MTKTRMNFLFPLMCLVLSLVFPRICAEGVRKGLAISLDSALPALFPALVLSGMMTRSLSGKGQKSTLLIPFFVGLFCGFPVGAKAVCDLYRKNRLTKKDAETLLFFCNNAGPAFLIGFCGAGLFSDVKKGLVLFLIQSITASCFLLCFFGKTLFRKEKKVPPEPASSPSFFQILPSSLLDASNSFLYVMSCVIFFSFFTELVLSLVHFSPLPKAVFALLMELTGGVANLHTLPENIAFPLCALGCGWAGISVHLQTLGLLSDTGLSPKKYLLGKGIFAAAMFLGALFLQNLL